MMESRSIKIVRTPVRDEPILDINCGIDNNNCDFRPISKSYAVLKSVRSIEADLNKYSFDEEIKNRANNIFFSMKNMTRRKLPRVQLCFWCVYHAHIELGREVDPYTLGKQTFKLTQEQIRKCDSRFSAHKTGYKPRSCTVGPKNFLVGYCTSLNFSEELIEEIKIFTDRIIDKDNSLKKDNPQTISAGILKYFLIINGIDIENSTNMLSQITGRSNATIENTYKRIALIDNE